MDIRQNRSWMYNRLMSNRRGYNEAFSKGVDEFVSYACQERNLSIKMVTILVSMKLVTKLVSIKLVTKLVSIKLVTKLVSMNWSPNWFLN